MFLLFVSFGQRGICDLFYLVQGAGWMIQHPLCNTERKRPEQFTEHGTAVLNSLIFKQLGLLLPSLMVE